MMIHAVVDRFEGRFAVLIVEGQSKPVNVSIDKLPSGAKEGDHLRVAFQDNQLIEAHRDSEATDEARKRIKEKVERLRRGEHLQKGNDS